MKTIKAIKIDVIKRDVYYVAIVPNLDGLHAGVETDCVEHLNLNLNGDDMYIDESGVLRDPQLPNFILDKGTGFETVPLVGHGLITGQESITTHDGYYITDCVSTVEEIKKRITFGDQHVDLVAPVILTGEEAEEWIKNHANSKT